jgi:RNA polymerase sigma-70 factor, ECF subfamily
VIGSTNAGRTDQDLVALALQGERQAFGELVERHRAGVVSVVYRMTGDAETAEEAAQVAFLKAWQRLYSFKTQLSFRNWIYSIAVHAALDQARAEKEMVSLDQIQLEAANGKPEAELEARERAEKVQQAVMELAPACRAVLVLREYEGLSYQEISTALDIPVGTVMSRLNYARSQLRQSLAALYATDQHVAADQRMEKVWTHT